MVKWCLCAALTLAAMFIFIDRYGEIEPDDFWSLKLAHPCLDHFDKQITEDGKITRYEMRQIRKRLAVHDHAVECEAYGLIRDRSQPLVP